MILKTSRKQIALTQLVCLLAIEAFVGQPVAAQTPNDRQDATGAKRGETRLSLDKQVAKVVATISGEERVPGLIAAIADAGGVITVSCDGIRKTGSPQKLTETDRFHIGSCTKAMTSTMLATLVADGKLSWETTLIKTFPELKDEIHSAYHGATLQQLVRHRAGIPANAENWWVYRNLEIKARRIAILKRASGNVSGLGCGLEIVEASRIRFPVSFRQGGRSCQSHPCVERIFRTCQTSSGRLSNVSCHRLRRAVADGRSTFEKW